MSGICDPILNATTWNWDRLNDGDDGTFAVTSPSATAQLELDFGSSPS